MNNNSGLALGLLFLLGLAGVAAIAIVISRRQEPLALTATPTRTDLPVASVVYNELAQAEVVRYENTEEIELQDIDKDLLMPRRIIIHRKVRQLP